MLSSWENHWENSLSPPDGCRTVLRCSPAFRPSQPSCVTCPTVGRYQLLHRCLVSINQHPVSPSLPIFRQHLETFLSVNLSPTFYWHFCFHCTRSRGLRNSFTMSHVKNHGWLTDITQEKKLTFILSLLGGQKAKSTYTLQYGLLPTPKAVYHSGFHNKHKCQIQSWDLVHCKSDMLSTDHCDLHSSAL